MANLFNSAQSSFLSLRRDLEDVLDEMELPWRVRREMDRLFAESTSPMSLWRNVEYLLEDFAAPFVVRRRIESVFARVLSGRHVDAFNQVNTFNGMNQGSLFSNHGSLYGSQFMPLTALTQNPYNTHFTHGSQFGHNPLFMQNARLGSQWQNPYFTQSYGSQWQNPYFTQSYGSQWQNPYFNQLSSFGSQFGQDPYFTNTRGFENTMFGQNPYFTQNYGTQFGVSPFTNTFGTQGSLFGRDFGAWNSPRNEWFASNRFNDGFTGRTRNTFNNVNAFNNPWSSTYGQYGNTFNGLNTFGGQPFNSQFNNQFGSQFNNQFGSQFGGQFGGQFGQEFVPPVELIERDGEFVVRVELAGVREQDVEIRSNEHILTIRGERRERFDNEVARHVGAYEYSERRYGTFTRTVTLPHGIDAAHIHAVFRDGVLELRIPQAETFRARRIPIGRIEEQRINGDQGMHGRPHVS